MIVSDLMLGLFLSLLFAPLFGMVGSLVVMITSPPEPYNPKAPMVTAREIRNAAVMAAVIFPVFLVGGAFMAKGDRESAASWEQYVQDHKCVVVDSRTRTIYTFNPATKTNQPSTSTEYLWRCDNGEQWHP